MEQHLPQPRFTDEVKGALSRAPRRELVTTRKGRGGRQVPYLKGSVVIDEANEVFGPDGWGYELVDGVDIVTMSILNEATGEIKQHVAYAATVRVTVVGAPPRSDTGFRIVYDDDPEGHSSAYKGAVTDAMKRAFRSFGERFGNNLDLSDASRQTRNSPESEEDAPLDALVLRRRARLWHDRLKREDAASMGMDELTEAFMHMQLDPEYVKKVLGHDVSNWIASNEGKTHQDAALLVVESLLED